MLAFALVEHVLTYIKLQLLTVNSNPLLALSLKSQYIIHIIIIFINIMFTQYFLLNELLFNILIFWLLLLTTREEVLILGLLNDRALLLLLEKLLHILA